jgi:drug/metabolite transporter (DMT)-like permease
MGWWFWDEIPGWTTAAGATLIILAGVVNLWQPRRRSTPNASDGVTPQDNGL